MSGTDKATVPVLDPTDPAGRDLREAIGSATSTFLDAQRVVLDDIDPDLAVLTELAAAQTAGGKRLRPALCVWGFVAAGGELVGEPGRALLRIAASLDLLHVSALVHDDVMDGSDLRRGAPAAHRHLEGWHRDSDRLGDPEAFGRAGAILLGDLLLMWSAELLQQSGFDADRLQAAQRIVETMRTEVTSGQYLDVLAQTDPLTVVPHETDETDGVSAGLETGPGAGLARALARAERVTEYKSARYTVVRPVQLGAALAGGDEALLTRLSEFGSPLGRAFQYRDDLLGVFGDSAVTGKPAGDDLREGKRTVLIAHATAGTDAAGWARLAADLGRDDLDADGIAALQRLIVDSDAVEAVEQMIAVDRDRALAALRAAEITDAGRTALAKLVSLALDRSA